MGQIFRHPWKPLPTLFIIVKFYSKTITWSQEGTLSYRNESEFPKTQTFTESRILTDSPKLKQIY